MVLERRYAAARVLAAGQSFYLRTFGSGENRWGDIRSVTVDPSSPGTFVLFNQFAEQQGDVDPTLSEGGRWGTEIGEVVVNHPPVLAATALQETSGAGPVALSAQVSFSDPDGDSAAGWRVEDVGSDPQGALLLSGVAQPENQAFNITAAQFAAMQIAPVATAHEIWVIGSDGTFSSAPVHFTYSSLRRHQTPLSLRPLGARSSH